MLKSLSRLQLLVILALAAGCGGPNETSQSIPDFSGHWEHAIAHFLPAEQEPGPVVNMPGLSFAAMNVWVGDYRNPILQPWANEAVRVHAVAELERGAPLLEQIQLCKPLGVPVLS
jgi:hypothetical protein